MLNGSARKLGANAMVGLPLSILAGMVGIFSVLASPVDQPSQDAQTRKGLEVEFKKSIKPLVDQFCLPCHNGPDSPKGVDLSQLSNIDGIIKDPARYEKVISIVRSQVMPPPSMDQPSKDQREEIVGWIQRVLASQCDLNNPGKVTIRRLNRAEYNNTIRDLVGLDYNPAKDFPSDDIGNGFDNIGDVLSISPLHLEKYMAAAREISERAIRVDEVKTYRAAFDTAKLGENSRRGSDNEIVFFSNDIIKLPVDVESDGQYMVKVVAGADQAGPEIAKLIVLNGQHAIQIIEINGTRAKPTEVKFPIEIKGRSFDLGVGFMNDFYDPKNPDPNKRDRNLFVYAVEVIGPTSSSEPLPKSHTEIIFTHPSSATDLDAPRAVLTRLISRAYRRPPDIGEVDRLLEIYKLVRSKGDSYERAIQVCLQAVLVNPHFLFRVELDNTPKNDGEARPLDAYELASRLSYFLWSSMPDDKLFEAARQGTILTPEGLEAEVKRMLANPKSLALAENFALQWLQVQRISEVSPDPTLFPRADKELLQSMATETSTFFNYIVRENRPIMELITADYTFLNGRLAALYGVKNVSGDYFEKVQVSNLPGRGGLLGMASILTVTSNPNRTSPVKRGKWVMEAILGTPPPPQPPNVGVLLDSKEAITTKNIRERMDLHRADPACFSCHKPLDALGFSMENFDAIGRWRTMDGTFPVDASGEMPSGRKLDGVADLEKLIVDRKDDFLQALIEKMLTYATGRAMTAADQCHVDAIMETVEKKGGTMQDLILEVVKSDVFTKKGVSKVPVK